MRGGLVVVLWLVAIWCSSIGDVEGKPNVIIILVDDLGFHDIGLHGSPDMKTQNIDNLGRNGAQFWNAYATAGFCSPSRASLLSGRNPALFGYVYNPQHQEEDRTQGMPLHIPILPETLEKEGYDNYIIGKWHLGFWVFHHPLNRGFHHFFGFLGGSFNYFRRTYYNKVYKLVEYLFDDFLMAKPVTYLTNDFTNKAITYINKSHRNRKPFFIYLSYNAPHAPFEYRSEDADTSVPWARRPHVAMVKAIDDGVGKIIRQLKTLGILKNTMVIFTNDNGGHPDGADNFPLSKYKGSFQEGGVRVPLFIYWDGKIAGGQNITNPVTLKDIYPTVQAAASTRWINRNKDLEGTNLMPFMRMTGAAAPVNRGEPHRYICLSSPLRGFVRLGRWKLMFYDRRPRKLFNLERDIGETRDLRSLYPSVVNQLSRIFFDDCDAADVPELFQNYGTTNPLKVNAWPVGGADILKGVAVVFKSKVTNNGGGDIRYTWEAFRPKLAFKATYRHVVYGNVPVTPSASGTSASIKFFSTGVWVVRVTVTGTRWTKWKDMTVRVS